MLAPSCRTRRAMRPAEIIGLGGAAPPAEPSPQSRTASLIRQRRDGRAGRCEPPVQPVMAAEAAVEVERLAAEVDLRPRAAGWVVAEAHAAAAGHLQPALETVGLRGEDVAAAHEVPEGRLACVL